MAVREYVRTGSPQEALRRAGFSATTARVYGRRYFSRPRIRMAVDHYVSEEAKKLGYDISYVLRKINNSGESADSDGQYAAALKAWELIGKHLRMWDEPAQQPERDKSEEELIAEAEALRKKLGL